MLDEVFEHWRGSPLGVQVLARSGADALTIGVAAALEDELGGWRHPAEPAG